MEYVEGFDLNCSFCEPCPRLQLALPAEFALFVIREVLRAFDYAHRVSRTTPRTTALAWFTATVFAFERFDLVRR